jgi:SHS2 domain-containing protein
MQINKGYREIEHTADWELRVWGPDIVALLETAAQGMYALSQTRLVSGSKEVREFVITYDDQESLLVDFLTELLFIGEDEGIGFDKFKFDLCEDTLKTHAKGAPIENQTKEIKAVTYHELQIREVEGGLEVHIVFDV